MRQETSTTHETATAGDSSQSGGGAKQVKQWPLYSTVGAPRRGGGSFHIHLQAQEWLPEDKGERGKQARDAQGISCEWLPEIPGYIDLSK